MKFDSTAIYQEKDSKNWPIIIGGFYRSGTSLLRRVLDTHSRIHCGPEVKFFKDFYGDYYKDNLKHVRFFKTLRDLDVEDKLLLSLFGSAFLAVHEVAAQKQGKIRWADKSPENVVFISQWNLLLESKFYFVHCVRHPLDCLASLKEAGFSLTVPESFEEKITLYRTFVEEGLNFERRNPSISFRFKYEDLVKDPRTSISKLMSFIHEDFEEKILNFNSLNHQSGLEDPKIRFTKGIHSESVGRSKDVLTNKEVNLVKEKCSDLFKQLNYE